jgi:hypothetical protein
VGRVYTLIVSALESASRSLRAVPPAPRTPGPRARQLIFSLQGKIKVLVLVGGFFLALGSLFTVIFAGRIPGDLAIAATGREITARVLSAELDRSTRINGRHPTEVRFAYTIDGEVHETSSSAVDQRLAALFPGQQVVVEVAPFYPAWARVSGTTRSWTGYFGLFTVLFPAIGALLLLMAVRSRRRAIRAFVRGEPTVAKVVYAGPDRSVEINGRHPFQVVWQFQVDGTTYEGSVSSMDVFLIQPLSRASELVVLYDRDDPRASTVYLD